MTEAEIRADERRKVLEEIRGMTRSEGMLDAYSFVGDLCNHLHAELSKLKDDIDPYHTLGDPEAEAKISLWDELDVANKRIAELEEGQDDD